MNGYQPFIAQIRSPPGRIGGSGLRAEAAKRDVTPDELAAEFIAERVKPRKHRLRFAAIGASTSGRRAVDAEDMLAEGFGR
jgi:hypothetical protein